VGKQRDRLVQRVFDVLLATMALVAVAPACLLIAILVKLDSKGPVFVTRSHIGRNGRRCSIAKFRTMHARGGRHLVALSAHDTEHSATCVDPRLTRVGRVVQHFGLDELPRLWSVLLGDMSLVDPRPLMAHETEEAWQPRRLHVRPGITSLWQNGRTPSPSCPGKVWRHTRREE